MSARRRPGLATNPPPGYDPTMAPRDGPRAPYKKRTSDLGRRLTARRQELGLTQEKFAAEIGVDLTTLQRWENGRGEPRGLYLKAVERFLAGE